MIESTENKEIRIRDWLKNKAIGDTYEPEIQYHELTEFTKDKIKSTNQYQRDLPHWESSGSTYFITFRVSPATGQPFLVDSNSNESGNQLASIVEERIWFDFGERYNIDAYIIMPDHVHLLIQPLQEWSLSKILQGIKGFTARKINVVLNRKGPFWQDESMDHLIRNHEDWLDKFNYIHENPVKASIVERPEEYPYSSIVTLHSKGRLEALLAIISVNV
jgi:putative transposase